MYVGCTTAFDYVDWIYLVWIILVVMLNSEVSIIR